jgi:ABC-type dipeptide/oligopeptide/nickel transport system permease subunit
MIAEGRTFLSTDPWISLFPTIAMFSVLLALNLVADRLSARLDVREAQL